MSTPLAQPGRPRRFRLAASRAWYVPILAAATVLLAPVAALGATNTASSPVTGMNLTMDGARVTVSAGATPSRAFLQSVQGQSVVIACSAGLESFLGSLDASRDGYPDRPFDTSFLGGPVRWPAGATSASYDLPRDVSDSADGCIVGHVGHRFELASTFAFSAQAQAVLAEESGEQRLALAHHAAKLIARQRPDKRFPQARALTVAVAASEPQMKVAYARNIAAARRNDVVYIIGADTTYKRVQMAYRTAGEDPLRLVGRRVGEPTHIHRESDVPVPESRPGDRRGAAGRST